MARKKSTAAILILLLLILALLAWLWTRRAAAAAAPAPGQALGGGFTTATALKDGGQVQMTFPAGTILASIYWGKKPPAGTAVRFIPPAGQSGGPTAAQLTDLLALTGGVAPNQ